MKVVNVCKELTALVETSGLRTTHGDAVSSMSDRHHSATPGCGTQTLTYFDFKYVTVDAHVHYN